jgi:hypothetical protein
MKKYIEKTLNELKAIDAGMVGNPADWTSTPVKEADVTAAITSLTAAGNSIAKSEALLAEQRVAGSTENKTATKLANRIIDLAYGIYATNPEKLTEYGIKPRKKPAKVPAPALILAIGIENDSDGEGFILSLVDKDPVADTYEWEKGQGTDPKDVKNIPAMSFYVQTSKIKFVDDDIMKGVRYFYRVRGVNRNGHGPWSEAVSKVQ